MKSSDVGVEEWTAAISQRFSINAADRQLRASPIFDIQLIQENGKRVGEDAIGRTPRFSLKDRQLQLLPQQSLEK